MAPPAPTWTLSPTTVANGDAITASGTGCTNPDTGDSTDMRVVVILHRLGYATPDNFEGDGYIQATPADDGTWSGSGGVNTREDLFGPFEDFDTTAEAGCMRDGVLLFRYDEIFDMQYLGADADPTRTISAPAEVMQYRAFTISGTGCTRPGGTGSDLSVSIVVDGPNNDEVVLAQSVGVAADGTWSKSLSSRQVFVRHDRDAAFKVTCRTESQDLFRYDPVPVRVMGAPLEASFDVAAAELSVLNPCGSDSEQREQSTYDLYLEGPDGHVDQLATASDPFDLVPYGLTTSYPLPDGMVAGTYTVLLECQDPPISNPGLRYQFETDLVWAGTDRDAGPGAVNRPHRPSRLPATPRSPGEPTRDDPAPPAWDAGPT